MSPQRRRAHDTFSLVTYLWDTLDLWGFVWIAAIDSKGKLECRALVHAYDVDSGTSCQQGENVLD